ncbi:hypothetical protein EMCRGX_G022453 [Ephydatia muelleri]
MRDKVCMASAPQKPSASTAMEIHDQPSSEHLASLELCLCTSTARTVDPTITLTSTNVLEFSLSDQRLLTTSCFNTRAQTSPSARFEEDIPESFVTPVKQLREVDPVKQLREVDPVKQLREVDPVKQLREVGTAFIQEDLTCHQN